MRKTEGEGEILEEAYGGERKRSVDRRVGGAAESTVESRQREGAQRGMYFAGGGEERERRVGSPSFKFVLSFF